MKALVTGGAGFIGSHLALALIARGDDVAVLDDLSTGKRENLAQVAKDISFIEGDVADFDTVRRAAEGVDRIFHLAAVASVQKSIEDPIDTNDINVGGTLNVLQAAKEAGAKRVVYASSSAVYGDLPELPKTEASPCCPKTPYGLHKMIGEGYARLYKDLHGLSSVGMRFFNVFGPRQDASSPYSGVISIFKEKLFHGEPITIFGDGTTTRDFVYVADVVEALLAAADAKDPGMVYNIGTGVETSLLDVVTALETALGATAQVVHAPERAGDIKRSVADASQAERELSWTPAVPFAAGIAAMIEQPE